VLKKKQRLEKGEMHKKICELPRKGVVKKKSYFPPFEGEKSQEG